MFPNKRIERVCTRLVSQTNNKIKCEKKPSLCLHWSGTVYFFFFFFLLAFCSKIFSCLYAIFISSSRSTEKPHSRETNRRWNDLNNFILIFLHFFFFYLQNLVGRIVVCHHQPGSCTKLYTKNKEQAACAQHRYQNIYIYKLAAVDDDENEMPVQTMAIKWAKNGSTVLLVAFFNALFAVFIPFKTHFFFSFVFRTRKQ